MTAMLDRGGIIVMYRGVKLDIQTYILYNTTRKIEFMKIYTLVRSIRRIHDFSYHCEDLVSAVRCLRNQPTELRPDGDDISPPQQAPSKANLHFPDRQPRFIAPAGQHCDKPILRKMHASVVNVPIRTAVLGTRFSSAGLAPFTYAGTASTPFNQQQQTTRTVATKFFQKRSASSIATKSQNPAASCCTRLSCQRPTLLLKSPSAQAPTLVSAVQKSVSGIRANSTASAASTSRGANASSNNKVQLDWNTFFKLRTSRRRYGLVSSIITSIASTAVGVQILSTQDLESLGAQVMGLDPFVVLGLATAACGAVGWLAGPFLGNAIWGLIYRRYRSGVAVVSRHLHCFIFIVFCWNIFTDPGCWTTERERVLRPDKAVPRGPVFQLHCQPGAGLLR